MTDERPSDAEMDAMIAEMVQADLLTVGTDAQDRETWTLTAKGARSPRRWRWALCSARRGAQELN